MATDDVIQFLYEKEYWDIQPLGKGCFSVVFSAISPTKDSVAVKIVKYEDSWHVEESFWPVLKHKNILPLNEMIDIEYLNVKLFIMPRMPYVLVQMLASDSFMNDSNGLRRVKQWLSDTLDGLEYLHLSGFAHLDLKTNNVLISADDRALLCDFTGLDFIGVPLKTLCIPPEYCPPEEYDVLRCNNLEGTQCDVWLFGLMTLNILTKSWASRRMGIATDAQSWKTNVEPILQQALTKSTFLKIMDASFPSVNISDEELSSAHDFVTSMMQWEPDNRPSVRKIRCHPFLTRTDCHDTISVESPDPKEPEKIVSNSFRERWIDPETREGKTDNIENDILDHSVKTDIENVVTNLFHEGQVDPEVNNKETLSQRTKKEMVEQMVILNPCSHQYIEKTGVMQDTRVKDFPVDRSSEKTSRFDGHLFETGDVRALKVDKYNVDASKQKKSLLGRLKRWFRNKWNLAFKKKNKYELFEDVKYKL